MTADLYPRPDRDAIAARVRGQLPGATPPAADPAPTPREALEAACWRTRRLTGTQVDAILDAADDYAIAYSAEVVAATLDRRARDRRLSAAEASAAEHRDRLERATAERTGRAT